MGRILRIMDRRLLVEVSLVGGVAPSRDHGHGRSSTCWETERRGRGEWAVQGHVYGGRRLETTESHRTRLEG